MNKYAQDYKILYKRKVEEVKVLEKALELSQRHIVGFKDATLKTQVDWRENRVKENCKYFIQQAKEEFEDERFNKNV